MSLRVLLVAAAVWLLVSGPAAEQIAAIDKAFESYWRAGSGGDSARAGERLVKAGVDFETAWTYLQAGRPYKKEKTGEFSWRYPGPGGAVFDNGIEVPEDYDPGRRWQVRVQLHGGVTRRGQGAGDALSGLPTDNDDEGGGGGNLAGGGDRAPSLARRRAANRIPGESQIYVYPGGWADAAWWHVNQVDNILRVLNRLKRTYNVDESRVYFTGISDGGTGVYYMGMRESTPWASFLPLNGSLKVLSNPDIKVEGELYPANLTNKPLYIVNGGLDPLYPVQHVQTHVEALEQLGVSLVFSPQPAAGHDTSWWRWERTPYEQFVRSHQRSPHPAKLSWETERVDRFNRVHWLVVDRLGGGQSDSEFEEPDIFVRKKLSGRVVVERQGNTVQARSRGVKEFTLLISRDAFDLSQPILVTVNGHEQFHGQVKEDVATLFKWAARDNDRTMLYGAEIKIQVP